MSAHPIYLSALFAGAILLTPQAHSITCDPQETACNEQSSQNPPPEETAPCSFCEEDFHYQEKEEEQRNSANYQSSTQNVNTLITNTAANVGSLNRQQQTGTSLDKKGEGSSADSIADSGRLSPFAILSNSDTDKRASQQSLAFEQSESSILLGVDYRVSNDLVAGALISYSDADAEMQGNLGDTDTSTYLLGLYASRYYGNLFVDGFISYGQLDLDTERSFGTSSAEGSTDGAFHNVDIAVGTNIQANALSLTPSVRLSHTRGEIDGYTEKAFGGGITPITVDDQKFESFNARASLLASYAVLFDWGVLLPSFTFSYIHEYSKAQSITTSVAGFSNTQAAEAPVRNYREGQFNLSAQFRHGLSAFLSYSRYADNELYDRDSASLGIRYEMP